MAAQEPQGPLAPLCRYYLECISRDSEIEISEFARSEFKVKYCELPNLPFAGTVTDDPLSSPEVRGFVTRARQDRLQVYLGYPLRLHWHRARSGWEGYKLDPVLLFSFRADSATPTAQPTLSDEAPSLNAAVLKSFRRADSGHLIDEIILISEDLGLGNPASELPEPDEIAARLRQIRPDWDWCEEIDAERLSSGPPMAELDAPGIYNRAALFVTESSPYTRGLETELNQLASMGANEISNTVLGQWLSRTNSKHDFECAAPLLEPVPLNTEQREAIVRAFAHSLTVITGPPGTGKSQLITALLVNAAWRRQRVIFASKNNKAVDVVEERVNGLGSRPILLRLGANQYQDRLASYLTQLLASVTEPGDSERYTECESRYVELRQGLDRLDTELARIVELRNRVDDMEKRAEMARQRFGAKAFQQLSGIDLAPWKKIIAHFAAAVWNADRKQQLFLQRCFWSLTRKRRVRDFIRATNAIEKFAKAAGRTVPLATHFDEDQIGSYVTLARDLTADVEAAQQAKDYLHTLQQLNKRA
jgi:hypothetical protein